MLRTALLNPNESQKLPPNFHVHFQECFVMELSEETHSPAVPACLNKPNSTAEYQTEPFSVAT